MYVYFNFNQVLKFSKLLHAWLSNAYKNLKIHTYVNHLPKKQVINHLLHSIRQGPN